MVKILDQLGSGRKASGITLREAIENQNLSPPKEIPAGRFVRFPGADKGPSNDAGWCILSECGEYASFGDWSTCVKWDWTRWEPVSDEERAEQKRQREQAWRRAKKEREVWRQVALPKINRHWADSQPVSADHPYLKKKNVGAYDIRQRNGVLLIPMRDMSGKLNSLQYIDPEGKKQFARDTDTAGCFHLIGDPGKVLYVAEGYATAGTIHEATGQAVAVAFTCDKLKSVAVLLRSKYPGADIIVAADNDADKPSNTGVACARAAAEAVSAQLVLPPIAGDFNDLAAIQGISAVKRALEPKGLTRRLSDIEAKPLRWLWRDRLAVGKVTIDAGDPGLGKSLITADITAKITAGLDWPDGSGTPERGSVIFASAEDDAADTIRPRLEAAGGDVSKVFILESVIDTDSDGLPVERAFSLKRDLLRLDQEVRRIGDVRLVVVDPITAFLGDVDSHKNAEVRALLAPLKDLASRHEVAVLAVSHLNKGNGGNALYRVSGSLAFVAAARAAWLIIKDPEDEQRRLVLPCKNNLAPDVGGFAYRIGTAETSVGPVPVIHWEPGRVDVSAIEALAPDHERDAKEEAKEFLVGCLNDGVTEAKAIQAAARGAGIAEKTLRRAKAELGIRSEKDGFAQPPRWHWRLPAKVANPAEDGQRCPREKLATLATFNPDEIKTAKVANDHLQNTQTPDEQSEVEGGQDGQENTGPSLATLANKDILDL